jgi:hypothetical protein
MDAYPTNKRTKVDMKQPSPHTSNAPTMEGMHTNVQETVGDSVVRGAVYLAAAWQEYTRHEFQAHSLEDAQVEDAQVEDAQVDWQGSRYVLGESDYYLPDSTRARWSIDAGYNQGNEEEATAYEWFLKVPPVVPILLLWVAGVALLGTGALVLYWVGWVLAGFI